MLLLLCLLYTSPVTGRTSRIILEGLFTTVTNVSFDGDSIREMIRRVQEEKAAIVPGCRGCGAPCGQNNDYGMAGLWYGDEDIRSLKSLILLGIRGMAAYAYHAMVLGYSDETVNRFFLKALFSIGEDWGMEELLPIVLETGEVNLRCMESVSYTHLDVYKRQLPHSSDRL